MYLRVHSVTSILTEFPYFKAVFTRLLKLLDILDDVLCCGEEAEDLQANK